MERKKFLTVDEYIQSFPEHVQAKLVELRTVIKELVPEAQEKISYSMPAFFLNGILVWYAGFSRHIGFYPKASGIEAFESELSGYKYAKGSIQFPIEGSLPIELIEKIVNFRVGENLGKKSKKSNILT
ncbi:MAG TPA: DUF1801 domain-containing protein [Candidatus Lokiarchaeia archaeon]|nr:DUF1801 domain-containing protein [Candidatus Lokiarchaeia archaeon]